MQVLRVCSGMPASTVWAGVKRTSPPLPSPPHTPGIIAGLRMSVLCCQSNHKILTFLLPRAKGSSHLTPEPTRHICTHQYGPGNLTLSQNLLQLMSAVQPPSTILLLPPTALGLWECHSSGLDQMKHRVGQSLIQFLLDFFLLLHHHCRLMWRMAPILHQLWRSS